MPTKKSGGFTAVEASAITGIPYRTIDNWARTSLVVPSIAQAQGTGTERRYSFDDLVALRVARQLRKARISKKSLKDVIRNLRKKKNLQNLQNPLSGTRLAVVGRDVVVFDSCDCLMSILEKPGQGVFVFMVDVKRASSEVQRRVEEFRAA